MNSRFVAAFMILPDPKDEAEKYLLVLTLERLIYLSFKSKKKVNYSSFD